MMKTFKYKLYPSRRTRNLDELRIIAGEVRNYCLQYMYDYHALHKTYPLKDDLQKIITQLKKLEEYNHWNILGSQAIQDVTEPLTSFGKSQLLKLDLAKSYYGRQAKLTGKYLEYLSPFKIIETKTLGKTAELPRITDTITGKATEPLAAEPTTIKLYGIETPKGRAIIFGAKTPEGLKLGTPNILKYIKDISKSYEIKIGSALETKVLIKSLSGEGTTARARGLIKPAQNILRETLGA